MALSKKRILNIMRHSFPSWTDIRKRTNKSVGGKMLTAYSNEFDKIQEAIDDYKKIFFLLKLSDDRAHYIFEHAAAVEDKKCSADENNEHNDSDSRCYL